MILNMEMHQVRYFLAVARTLNFTRAADECNVTQPSLTRAVQKLEDELGGLLFRRERSLTHLTDLGRMMLPHLERTFEAAQAAKALAQGLNKAQVAPLSLGVAHSASCSALSEVIRSVADSLPGFELSMTTGHSGDLIDQAMKGELDLLLVEAPDGGPERLEAWRLFIQTYRMITAPDHRLARSHEVPIGELASEIWVDCGGDGAARLRAQAALAGFTPDFRHRTNHYDQTLVMVRGGLGSALMVTPGVDERLGVLSILDADMMAPVVLAGIAGRKRSPAADAFVRAARARAWPDR
ncbi:LysR family transcriptional regulator [Sphingomonas sp. SFZ2018-12]|uniref:LysR family transcriptional regulator n=1 Tax=Sphingomonas sp. SFZ2018-12 TaxID=2683197 RepID=UPI001F0FF4B1